MPADLIEAILERGRSAGGAPAICDPDGGVLDYAGLAARSSAAASAIRRRHGGGGFLLVRPRPSADALVALLGVIASGNTAVPVAEGTTAAQLEYIGARCGGAPELDEALIAAGAAAAGAAVGAVDWAPAAPPLVLFTSGTTGEPKGVVVTAANLQHSCATIAEYLGYAEHAAAAVVLPLHYSYSLISQVLAQLYTGGAVHLFAGMRNPIKVAAAVNERGIGVFSGVPATFAALAMCHGMQPIPMPRVRVVCSAGAPYDLSLHARVREIFPAARVFNNYGATEATPRIAYVTDAEPEFFDGSCGRPMAGLEVVAVDPRSKRPLGEGERGIIAVRGPSITPGYLDDPDRTAAAFADGGWFLTNDIGSVRAGHIYVEGRADDIFDVGGEKVAPGEIEQALLTLPEIEAAAVVGRRDPARGHVPVAFVKTCAEISKAEINERVGRLLAPIKLPLRYYRVTSFPHTANGKLKRRELDTDEAEYKQHEIS